MHTSKPIRGLRTRLRAARETAGLTRREMAELIGIGETLLKQLEGGHLEPTERVAALLETALGEPADRLLRPVAIKSTLPVIVKPRSAQ